MMFNTRLISLIGFPRSGTTFIARNLKRHSEITYWEEPKYLWRYKMRPYDYDDSLPRDESTARRYINKRLNAFSRKKNTKYLLEKTPSNVFRLDYIKRIVPDVLFLFVFRKPDDVLRSYRIKQRGKTDYSVVKRRLKNRDIPVADLPFALVSICRVILKKYLGKTNTWGIRLRTEGVLDTDEKILKAWIVSSKNIINIYQKSANDYLIVSYESYCENVFVWHDKIADFYSLQKTGKELLTKSERNQVTKSVFNWTEYNVDFAVASEAESVYEQLNELAQNVNEDKKKS